ncbi:T9SS type B sorting domain-containing protein [Chitinophaga agri]|uniref:T9SS type B sorting domain-containing protein n=1 Tax=Chitinophaga agri TaxID=2703787 RepID=A0A6B9ZA67_9BACT|nr:gliding motility-associated C-terminal domain-containing protein [Chitinophaga agri]QHS59158.1 T9SS type B sorting domain-containing protein [Chitinophaga agri]
MSGNKRFNYIFLLQLIFSLICTAADAQQVVNLKNPSLDPETPGSSIKAAQWDSDAPYPVVGPDFTFDSSKPASEGRYFIELFSLYTRNSYATPPGKLEFWSHAIGQQLDETLYAGRTYEVSFDLKTSTYDPYPNLHRPFYGSMVIMGSAAKGGPEVRLYASGRFYHNEWKRYTAVFTPPADIDYFRITAVSVDGDTANVVTDIDNLSPITETLKMEITTGKSCPEGKEGFVRVVIPDAVDTYTYLWMPGNYTTAEVKGLAPGIYHLTVRGASGAVVKKDVEVAAYDLTATKAVTDVSCSGKGDGAIVITAVGGQPPYTYQLEGAPEVASGTFNNMVPGNYHIVVKDQLCTTTVRADITEPSLLTLEQVQTRAVTCNSASDGQIILAASGGTPPYRYGVQSGIPQPDSVIRLLEAGTYQYTVTDAHACMVSGEAVITKESRACAVFVPTAFSPNGDGQNDVFRIKLQDAITDYRLAVYGRWGQLVYETRDAGASWNGRYKEAPLPAGSYVWTMTYTDSKGQLMQQQGTIMLIL